MKHLIQDKDRRLWLWARAPTDLDVGGAYDIRCIFELKVDACWYLSNFNRNNP